MEHGKIIQATEDSPLVEFDLDKGVLYLQGKSIMEDAHAFYSPLVTWFKRYVQVNQRPLVVIVQFDYLNSGTSRFFMEILFELGRSCLEHTIIWRYENGDDVIQEKGMQFHSLSDINFVLVEAELT